MSQHRNLGIVKWFDSKSGYGFIKSLSDESNQTDVFVHFSALGQPDTNQYKYLVLGEYVHFEFGKTQENKICALNVSGIGHGPLMCDSRRLANQTQKKMIDDKKHDDKNKPKNEKYVNQNQNQNRRNRINKQ